VSVGLVGTDPEADRPSRRPAVGRDELVDAAVALAASGALAVLVRIVLDWGGFMGTGVLWYLAFLAGFSLVGRDGRSLEAGIDRLMTVVVWSIGAGVVAVLAWMIVYLAIKGIPALEPSFFSQDMAHNGPLNPGGGVKAAIVGSAEQVGLAMAVVVPIAVLTAIYLQEIKGRMATPIRFAVDSLSGVPSIVAGLIVYTVWVLAGHGFSGVAGSAALAVLALPTVTRASEETLRVIPDSLREASLALGAPQWRVVSKVVLPTALSGLTTGVILGMARILGETAPLLLTTGYSSATNYNLFSREQASLPVFAWTLISEPNQAENVRAFGAAFVLVLLVLILFIGARYFAGRSRRTLGGRR
jgi:phosphate transport system permease protein